MHPIFAQRERLWLYMAAWLIIAGLSCVLFVLTDALTIAEAVALLVPMSLLYAFICLSSLYLCRALPLQQSPFLTVAGSVVLAAFLSASAWTLLGKGIAVILSRSETLLNLSAKYDAIIPIFLGGGTLLFVLGVVVHYLLLAFDLARSAERKALELQVLAREAELKALRSQIQPHFLFNSLNSISALTTSNPTAARAMALQLAEYFRTTLRLGQEHFIPLNDEINLAENFLSIEQVRFGSRLMFTRNVGNDCSDVPVPSLILQPLVENAVNHGIAHLLEGGTIAVTAVRLNDALVLKVSNPCDPVRPQNSSSRVGLTNIRKRLTTLYGQDAHVAIDRQPEMFCIELRIPIQAHQ